MRGTLTTIAIVLVCLSLFSSPTSAQEDEKNGVECTICEFLVGTVEDLLKKNATEQEIIKELDKACSYLPGSLSGICENLVDTYGVKIIQMLLDKETPDVVCTQLGLCTSAVPVHIPKPNGDVECAICKYVLTEVYNILEENTTESEIEAALDKVCALLPAALKGPCDTLVAEYFPILVQYIEKSYTPDEICTAIHVCTSKKPAPKTLSRVRIAPLKDFKCAACQYIVAFVEKFLEENRTEHEIIDFVDKVCTLLPSDIKSTCDMIVETYGAEIIEYIIQEEDPQTLCLQLGLCSSSRPAKLVMNKPAPNDLKCAVCEYVISLAEKFMEQNRTEQEVIEFIEKVCTLLPSSLKSECDALISEYGPEIIEYLINQVPPNKICSMIGLCSSASATNGEQPNDFKCAACEYIIAFAEKFVTKNSTEQEIIAFVEKVCDLLPSTLKSECDMIVETYGPELIQWLINKEDPATFCSQIGLCSSKTSPNDFKCAACEYIIAFAEKFVTKNSTEQEIIAFVEKVCDLLPSTLKSECDMIVETYGPELIQWLINKEDPATFCSQIGLCTSKMSVPTKNQPNDLKCAICEYVIAFAEKMLTKNATEQEIISFVEKVCDLLPSSLKSECDMLIETYGPELIQWLVNKEDPATFCSQVGLCSSKQATPVNEASVDIECAVCEYVVSVLEDLISENATEREIVAALDKVCDILPVSLQSMCVDLVGKYTPEIVAWFLNHEDPAKLCAQIGLCQRDAPKPEVQGSNDLKCAVCEYVFAFLEKILHENRTEADIEKALDEVCDLLPVSIKTECVALVNSYTPEIIDWFLQEEPPERLCTQIKLCQSEEPEVLHAEANSDEGALECELCKLITGELEKLITKESTEEEIIEAVEKVCLVLPKSTQPACAAFINTYGKKLIDLLIKKETPSVLCSQVGLCTSAETVKDSNDFECAACEFAMATIDKLLSDNATDHEIAAYLERVCDLLPKELTPVCDTVIETYGPEILYELSQKADPEVVCTKIGACPRVGLFHDIQKLLEMHRV